MAEHGAPAAIYGFHGVYYQIQIYFLDNCNIQANQ